MTVSEHQLALDLDALARLVDSVRARRHVPAGAERLLAELVRGGLAERDLISAAALVLQLDRPKETA
jgi:hypothetical protein